MNTVEVTSRGWLARMKNALAGLLVGLLLVPGSMVLLGWNEYRAVKEAKAWKEGQGAVLPDVEAGIVDPDNENRLVHVVGNAQSRQSLSDPDFDLTVDCLRLRRDVQMYQWCEETKSKTRKKLGGGEETVTEYSYEMRWAPGRRESSEFKEPEGHKNPKARYQRIEKTVDAATLGAFQMTPALLAGIDQFEPVLDLQPIIDKMPPEQREHFAVSGNELYYSRRRPNPDVPQIGDLKIQFSQVPHLDVTVVAQQSGNSFRPYLTRNQVAIEIIEPGRVSADDVFEKKKRESKQLTWILRLVGVVLMTIGFSMVFGLLATMLDVVPILGNLARGFGFLVSLMLAIAISIFVIAISWVAVRPLLGIGLLLASAIALFAFFKLRKKAVKRLDDHQVELVGN